jgi:phage FluMu protein gp41
MSSWHAIDCGVEFALAELTDDDIHQIAARLASEHEHNSDDSDYLIAARALHGFIVLRQMIQAIGEGKIVPVPR